MDIYTLTPTFLSNEFVDDLISAIWTERYTSAGDVQLTVPDTAANRVKFAPGTFLGLRGSKEVMMLETQAMKDKLLTLTGPSLLKFLNNRYAWFRNLDTPGDGTYIADYQATAVPGQFIADVVSGLVISPPTFAGVYANLNLDWAYDAIDGLVLGPVDTSGSAIRLNAPIGPIYDSIQPLAESNKVGIKLYLDSADPITGFVLKFSTYRGTSRTSADPTLIRLSPTLDTLGDVQEIQSNAEYKNVAYVLYQNQISTHYADPLAPIPEGFERRVLVVDAVGEPKGSTVTSWNGSHIYQNVVTGPDVTAFRAQTAKDALANHNYIRAVDGQVSAISDYVFGVDYGLGDTIELEGYSGIISNAQIIEYIRTKDGTGEKAYPTLTVVD